MAYKVTGILLCLFFFMATMSFAFLYEVEVLDSKAISKLSNEELADRYIDVLIELDASSTFHKVAGISPKEYQKYKKLLRYKVDLLSEIKKREMEIPSLNP